MGLGALCLNINPVKRTGPWEHAKRLRTEHELDPMIWGIYTQQIIGLLPDVSLVHPRGGGGGDRLIPRSLGS